MAYTHANQDTNKMSHDQRSLTFITYKRYGFVFQRYRAKIKDNSYPWHTCSARNLLFNLEATTVLYTMKQKDNYILSTLDIHASGWEKDKNREL